MNRLEGRFAAGQITGGRENQEDDYGLIEGAAGQQMNTESVDGYSGVMPGMDRRFDDYPVVSCLLLQLLLTNGTI